MKKIKWGILGTGLIARKFVTALNSIDNAEVYSIGARTLEKAKTFKEDFNATKYYGSITELMKDKDVDIIYIATPHSVHREHVLECLENNKNVLCEKPMALNIGEVDEMIALAKKKKLFLMEALWTRFMPITKELLNNINNNEIGKIKLVRADFGFIAIDDLKSRMWNPDLAGGALLDIGIYTLFYIMMIFKREPINMKSYVTKGETGVDASASVILDFGNGQRGEMSISFDAMLPTEAIIVGEDGYIRVEQFYAAEKATIYKGLIGIDQRVIELPFSCNGYEYEAQAVSQMILDNKKESELVPFELTRSLARTMDKLRKEWDFVYPKEKK